MDKRFVVQRVVSVLQATVIFAKSEEDAITKSKKTLFKTWKTLDNKRRKNYTAEQVNLKG